MQCMTLLMVSKPPPISAILAPEHFLHYLMFVEDDTQKTSSSIHGGDECNNQFFPYCLHFPLLCMFSLLHSLVFFHLLYPLLFLFLCLLLSLLFFSLFSLLSTLISALFITFLSSVMLSLLSTVL